MVSPRAAGRQLTPTSMRAPAGGSGRSLAFVTALPANPASEGRPRKARARSKPCQAICLLVGPEEQAKPTGKPSGRRGLAPRASHSFQSHQTARGCRPPVGPGGRDHSLLPFSLPHPLALLTVEARVARTDVHLGPRGACSDQTYRFSLSESLTFQPNFCSQFCEFVH